MPVYNKLVRDRIPEIIAKSGKIFETRILADQEFMKELKMKAQEEFNEYLETDSDKDAVEELSDLLEVVYALAKVHGASVELLEKARKQKADARGAFEEKVFLVKVED
ncbi:nucleoside triphosphate pyrophosphohydrolase [Bacillus carboniphilus]|uniref:Nucleoside triphosphate pyrophosphohydrolase n=1 Tax=Bacillus carboniphilus TaxID=86663 RepID=A0ABP3GEH7_9BACI